MLFIKNRNLSATNTSLWRAKIGEIAAIHINNKYYIKRIDENAGNIVLLSENPEYLPYTVSAEDKFKIIGLVTNIIKRVS